MVGFSYSNQVSAILIQAAYVLRDIGKNGDGRTAFLHWIDEDTQQLVNTYRCRFMNPEYVSQ